MIRNPVQSWASLEWNDTPKFRILPLSPLSGTEVKIEPCQLSDGDCSTSLAATCRPESCCPASYTLYLSFIAKFISQRLCSAAKFWLLQLYVIMGDRADIPFSVARWMDEGKNSTCFRALQKLAAHINVSFPSLASETQPWILKFAKATKLGARNFSLTLRSDGSTFQH
jgi:hypothetical protein